MWEQFSEVLQTTIQLFFFKGAILLCIIQPFGNGFESLNIANTKCCHWALT